LTKLEIKVLSADFAVSGQIDPASLAQIAESGFRSIINNRPDGEGGVAQPSAEDFRQMASTAGLQYAYLPVDYSGIDASAVERFRMLLQSLPKPILSFCATGRRSSELYRLATTERD
jgi:uncharacterized protein (TIGR01244 family)